MTQQQVPGDETTSGLVGAGGAGETSGATAGSDTAVVQAVAEVTQEDLNPAERRHAIGQLAVAMRSHGFTDMLRPRKAMAWISDTVISVAPRIPLRDIATLRKQHPGLTDDQIADRIVSHAARTTAGIGALGGGISAIEWAVPPTLLTAPAVLAAETVAVVAVEIKLLGELQELYGQPVAGGQGQRAASLLQAWAGRRGVSLLSPGRGLTAVLGTAARHELRDRLVRRFGRNLTALGPLFTGAAIAAYLNRRATISLAHEVRDDLSRSRTAS